MMPRSQSNPSGAENFGIRPKKKPAPPRPPQPNFKNSQSFRSSNELKSFQNQNKSATISIGQHPPTKSDLIDFSTPPPSPKSTTLTNLNTRIINEMDMYTYRVGASVFYIKSPLKNSTSGNTTQLPFSPPRPSAESMLSTPTPIKTSSSNNNNNKPSYQSTSGNANHMTKMPGAVPTIIRQQHGGSVSSNSTSSNNSSTVGGGNISNNNNKWNANSRSSHEPFAQNRYSNVPLTWDSPPKKYHPVIAPKPTIIRPPPINMTTTTTTTTATTKTPIQQSKRNYYDEPPVELEHQDSNDWDDDDDLEDTIDGPPMPIEPPPPPPPDFELVPSSQWLKRTETAETYYNPEQLPESYGGVETDQPYAIALYDYTPEAEGDLQLQAGDLVYLTKVIDESWLYGMCGGLEGMFPSNYVNVVVALPEQSSEGEQGQEGVLSQVPVSTISENNPESDIAQVGKYHYADVLYQFKAETDNDLNLEPGDIVTIWGRINDDWLYGALKRERGQFPSSFVSPVPENLPVINI